MSILVDGVKVDVPKGGELPNSPFTLQAIDFATSNGVTDDGTDRLIGLKGIRSLNFLMTPIKKLDFLDEMQSLESLQLGGTAINDESLAHVKGLKNLRLLYLQGNYGEVNVTDAGLEHLKGLSELTLLEIYGTKATDVGINHLSGLANLEYIAIGAIGDGRGVSAITDQGLAVIAGFPKLRQLKIHKTHITDSGFAQHTKKLSKLHLLQLYETEITDAGLQNLKQLPALRRLYLGSSKFTKAGLEHLKELSNLEELHLVGTKVTDADVQSLQAALPKCSITK